MVMPTLYRGSVGGGGPVGPDARERGHRPHDHAGRVPAAQEIVAQARGRAVARGAEERGQTATAGLETTLGLGDLHEGPLDGLPPHRARNAFPPQLLAESPAADLAAAGARLRPEAREGLVVDVAAALQLVHDGAGDLRGGAASPEAPTELARAPGLHGEK